MITAGDFRNGVTFEYEGNVYQIIQFQHVKPGKGAAFVRTKIKNVITGGVVEKTFNPTDKMPKAHIDRRDMQYLYNDGELYYFMDQETFEQLPLTGDILEGALPFLKDEMVVKVLSYKGKVFGVEPPNFVELTITETEPGFKGDTATGATKPATLETGYTLNVPLFVDEGTVIRVDTRTGEYMERA
ncbi:MAG: elongation factor P [Clostridia bacterium]|nr:elongation factor P [Clostridia bacterium]